MGNQVNSWGATKSFNHGDRATCKSCGKVIYCVGMFGASDRAAWTTHEGLPTLKMWEDDEEARVNKQLVYAEECSHMPREFCNTRNSQWDFCGKVVKYEDQVSGLFACGHHRSKAAEEQKAEEARKRMEEERLRKESLVAFEKSEYIRAAQWLTDNGYGAIAERYKPDRYGYRASFHRTVEIDVFELYGQLSGTKEEGEDHGEVHSQEADPW